MSTAPTQPAEQRQFVAPSEQDPFVAAASTVIGGPIGRLAAPLSRSYWTVLRVLVVMTSAGFALGLLQKIPCMTTNWQQPSEYTHLCYSDMPPLFSLRGFADHVFPYIHQPLPGQEQLEYPVLTGMFMQLANVMSPRSALWFYLINSLLLLVCAICAVLATALTVKRRPWDAAMVALAPAGILTATINWDLLPVALTAIFMLLWARRYPFAAGVFLGLATAAKFYPILLIGPLLLLCWRAGKWRELGLTVAGTAASWLAVNVPFMVANFDGWAHFYTFSSERGQDFGSVWLALSNVGLSVPAESLNLLASGLFLLLCVLIAILVARAPRRPRFASLAFLTVAAFLLTNKVYSPQYVLWLIPLAVLARPRWRDFLVWQVGQCIYFVGIWLYLAGLQEGTKGLPSEWYTLAIAIHIASTLYFVGFVIRDILRPENDPVRTDGFVEDSDDPGGGVLDGSPDRAGWGINMNSQAFIEHDSEHVASV